MNSSPRLSLPLIAPAQAQKHVTHNEALRQLDLVVQLSLEGIDVNTPPALPQDGLVYALGSLPTAAWADQPLNLATWFENAWTFATPQAGWMAWDKDTGVLRVWDGSVWAIATDPGVPETFGINTGADTTNRLAVASDASLFTHDGADHQIKVNKATPSDTASLLFQDGFSGRAEMGLAGNDDFSIKVSSDGSTWADAMVIEASSGRVGFGIPMPSYDLHVAGPSAYLALADSNGVLGGSMSAAVRLFADGTEHGQLGFLGTSNGSMYLRNLQGDLLIEADSRDQESNSYIRFAVDGDQVARLTATGVGIGVTNPDRSLHISDVMRLEPSTAPASPAAGDIYFDAAASTLRCHDGTQWQDLF